MFNFYLFLCKQPEFVKTLSDILYHGGNSPVARMAAGLQLKNTLTSKDPTIKTQYQQRWLSFPEETRAYVKKNVMLFLISIRTQISFITMCWYYGECCMWTIQ
jgi:importin subunit beta-1